MAGTPARFGRVATRALSGAGALSSFVATAGYLSFQEATKPNLLSSFSDFDPFAVAMRVLYVLTMVNYPPPCKSQEATKGPMVHAVAPSGAGG